MWDCRAPSDDHLKSRIPEGFRQPIAHGVRRTAGMRPLLLKIILPPLLLFFLFATAADLFAASPISDYQSVFRPFYDADGTLLAATRRYSRGDDARFLVLDPDRFDFREMTAASVFESRPATADAWRETPFARALARQTAPPFPLQNDGLREAEHPVRGFFLTADLCPAKRPLDRGFIEALTALPLKQPVPLALMVSGLWIQRHQDDFAWLRNQVAAGKLAITWGNHSFTHPYDPAPPLEKNFLLSPGTDFTAEALSLEALLLEAGLIPSPFFRFPGLVSNRRLIEKLRDLQLIPIGSAAWLAKGETPRSGSLILVHANGNEPEGTRLLRDFLAGQRETFRRGDAALLPARRHQLLHQRPGLPGQGPRSVGNRGVRGVRPDPGLHPGPRLAGR